MCKRPEYQLIKGRLEEPRRFIQVVMGPRHVGKTTTVKQVLENFEGQYLFFSADDMSVNNSTWITDCWNKARDIKENMNLDSMILVIDEIQKIPNWNEAVKKEWDDDYFYHRNIKVLLIGSNRVLLEKGLANSLFGRFEVIKLDSTELREIRP